MVLKNLFVGYNIYNEIFIEIRGVTAKFFITNKYWRKRNITFACECFDFFLSVGSLKICKLIGRILRTLQKNFNFMIIYCVLVML